MTGSDLPLDDVGERLAALRALVDAGRYPDAYALFVDAVARTAGAEFLLIGATVATRIGRLAEAEEHAAAALDRFRASGDSDGRMRALNLLGVVRFERGSPADAERVFAEASMLARRLGDTLMSARTSNNLASVAHLQGRPQSALSLYREVLLDYQRLGDRRGMAETCHNVGIVYRQLGQWDAAERAAAEAVRHAEAAASTALVALALSGRAETDIERGDLALATRALGHAARLFEEAGDGPGGAQVRLVRAEAAFRRHDYADALAEAEATEALAAALEIPLMRAEAEAVAARAAAKLGRTEEAERRRRGAMDGFMRLGAIGFAARFAAAYGETIG